jgi:hypothetical protein
VVTLRDFFVVATCYADRQRLPAVWTLHQECWLNQPFSNLLT